MRHFLLVLASTSCTFGLGCSVQPAPPASQTATRADGIINGTPDPGHDAVVAILGGGSECSATVLAVDAQGFGFAITAGHCLSAAQTLFTGSDYNNPTAQYKIIKKNRHPLFDPNAPQAGYDFTMLKFSGAPANMATIPPLPAAMDMLATGTSVELVGFGEITGQTPNSQKYHVTVPLMNVGPLLIGFSGVPGGTCQGDSGGPAIVKLNGQEYVAGVTSYGVSGCTGAGADGRVSPFTDCFINAFIAGQPLTATCGQVTSLFPPETAACSACVTPALTGACANQDVPCKMMSTTLDCANYSTCIGICGETDTACQKACVALYPTGATQLNALNDCLCFQACPSQCVVECNGPKGTCGFSPIDATCKTCMEGSCCAEASACYNDPTCQMCQDANTPVGCDTNALSNAYTACLTNNCAGPCMITPGTGGAGGTGAAGTGAAGTGAAGMAAAGTGGTDPGTGGMAQAGAAGTGQAGTGTSGAGQAGKGLGGTGQAGSGTAGKGQGGSGKAGNGQGGSGVGGSGQGGTSATGKGGAGGTSVGKGGSAGSVGKAGGTGTAGTVGMGGKTGTAGASTGKSGASPTGGSGGASSAQNDTNNQPASGSSGGCAIASPKQNRSTAGLLALIGLAAAFRKRRARRVVGER